MTRDMQLEKFKKEFVATLPNFVATLEKCGRAYIKAAATVKAFQVEWEKVR